MIDVSCAHVSIYVSEYCICLIVECLHVLKSRVSSEVIENILDCHNTGM